MNRVSLTPPLRAASSVLQAGQPISITAQDSTDPDLDYIFYRWDWGDGRSLGAYDDNVIITSHTYAAAGTYTVTLTLTDNFGATARKYRAHCVRAVDTDAGLTFSCRGHATDHDWSGQSESRACPHPEPASDAPDPEHLREHCARCGAD